LPSHAEPSEDGDGLVIVVNADSGNGLTPTAALREALPSATVREVEVERGDEVRRALDESADHAIALGVAGGDGTVNTAAQVALEEEKLLMVVPSGTFNHLTGALGIETVDDAVAAVKDGHAMAIDVATVDGKAFLNAASFGGYVEFVDARERLEHRIGKWPAVMVALVRMLRSYEPVDVEIDGEPACVWMAFIGNCRYHPSGFAPSWRERFDDELLDFRYVDGSAPFARTRLTLAVLTGRLGRSKIYHQSVVRSLRISSLNGPLRLARDGETFEGSDDVLIEKLPKRLAVYAPHGGES
jgi:undecaprenyl-diphosphatase